MIALDRPDEVLAAVVHASDAPEGEPIEPVLEGVTLDRAVVTIVAISLDHDLDPATAAVRFLRGHRLSPEAERRAVAVGLAALAAWQSEAARAFLDSDEPEGVAWPLKLGIVTQAPGFAHARFVLDRDGRVVGVADSDDGPALVGPLDRLAVGELLAVGRFRWGRR